jgi:hypothetical protein
MHLLPKERLPPTVLIDSHDMRARQTLEGSLARARADEEKVISRGLLNHHTGLRLALDNVAFTT